METDLTSNPNVSVFDALTFNIHAKLYQKHVWPLKTYFDPFTHTVANYGVSLILDLGYIYVFPSQGRWVEWGKILVDYLSKDSTPVCIKVLALKFPIPADPPREDAV